MKIPSSRMEYFQKEPSVYSYRPCMFQGYGYKYNDLLIKKPSCYNSNSVDNCTEFSSICISKPISNAICSGLSYIIGGFVGSKSQINNVESHKFNMDLGAYIAEILATWEYQQELASVKGANKKLCNSSSNINLEYSDTRTSNASTEAAKEKKCLSNVVELIITTSPNTNINNKNSLLNISENCLEPRLKEEARISCVLCNSDDSNSKEGDNSKIDMERKHPTNDCKMSMESQVKTQKPTLEYLKNLENLRSIPISNNNVCIEKGNEISESLSSSSGCSNSSDSEHIICFDNCMASVFNRRDKYLKNVGNFLAADRFRRASECSIDSTDSESFIVFDDCFDENNDSKKFEKTYPKQENDDFNSEDDSDEYEDNEYNTINECLENNCDDYDLESLNKNIIIANQKWSKFYTNNFNKKNENLKKVKFNEDVKVNKIIAWDHAYRIARLGPWEQLARDRVRFQERISRLSFIISPILNLKHREKIYKKLYS